MRLQAIGSMGFVAVLVAACVAGGCTREESGGNAGAIDAGGSAPMTSATTSATVAATAQDAGGSSGPSDSTAKKFVHAVGDATKGKDVFRFETFGNEGFWTSVMKLPQGMAAAKLTPLQVLAVGVSVDVDAVPPAVAAKIAAEVKTDLSPAHAPTLNDPATTELLVEANAILGVSARNVKTKNGKLDIDPKDVYAGESVGITCAFCHSITDASVYQAPKGGSIGKRIDGPTNHNLNVGANLAVAMRSRAMYPMLALKLKANKGGSVSRKGPKMGLLSAKPTEAEVDAYLKDPELYPIGMFDDAPDGNGAPMHITPFFRTDLAAPWGSEGSIEILHNFGNLVYTGLLDLTGLTTPGGRQFLKDRGGEAGTEIADNYEAILAEMGVPKGKGGYPFVGREGNAEVKTKLPGGAKNEETPFGMRVDETKLKDMNAYLDSLHPPAGDKSDAAGIAKGRTIFRAQCTTCHNDDQSKFVPQNIVPYNKSVELYANAPARPDLFASYAGALLADRSAAGLAPVRDNPGTFDDKAIIVEASNRNQPRGAALPLLMDLARKPSFLHDDSVKSLDALLDPAARPVGSPHAFYITDPAERALVVKFLKSLDDKPLP